MAEDWVKKIKDYWDTMGLPSGAAPSQASPAGIPPASPQDSGTANLLESLQAEMARKKMLEDITK